jgi:hypothetical protein
MSERRFTRAIFFRLRPANDASTSERTFRVEVTQALEGIAPSIPGYPPTPTPRQSLEVFVAAVADGLPRSLDRQDRALASIVGESTKEAPDRRTSTFELRLPALSRAAMRPLGNILQCASERSAITEANIDEMGAAQVDRSSLEDLPRFAKAELPFSFTRSRGRDRYDMASLVVRFAKEPSTTSAERLERWGRAWASLLAAGAFQHSNPDRGHCGGYLVDVVDAYADEWVFHFEQLAITDESCFPFLERLSEIASTDPIVSVEIS